MKKFTAILLLLIYSVANIGMAAELNYCGNDLTSVSVFSEQHDECCYIASEAKNCCSSRHVLIKAETKSHQVKQQDIPVFSLSFVESVGYPSEIPAVLALKPTFYTSKAPPGKSTIPVLFCTFLI